MGKGDQKSRRGKIAAGSYGKSRPKKTTTSKVVATPKLEKPKKEVAPIVEKPKKEAAPKVAEEKPKTIRKKKTEE